MGVNFIEHLVRILNLEDLLVLSSQVDVLLFQVEPLQELEFLLCLAILLDLGLCLRIEAFGLAPELSSHYTLLGFRHLHRSCFVVELEV